jgi:large subunit ribosomal protein L24
MANKFHIRKGDTVLLIAGNSRGKKGRILEVLRGKDKAIVEGINMVTKHLKPSAAHPNGGIEKREAPVHISNMKVVDPSTGDATRIGRKVNSEGKLERYSKKTGEFIKNA